jgi:hypothetical protein
MATDHRQVDDDAIAGFDSIPLERIGEETDFVMELFVSECALLAGPAGFGRLAFPDEGGFVGVRGAEPFIEAIEADVQLSADEPFGEGLVPLEYALPGLEPHEFVLRLLIPEPFRGTDGFVVELAIVGKRFDSRELGKFFGRFENAFFG